jgi:hypothetical protein
MAPDKKSEVLFEKAKSVTVGDLHDELRYTERHMLFSCKSGREQVPSIGQESVREDKWDTLGRRRATQSME